MELKSLFIILLNVVYLNCFLSKSTLLSVFEINRHGARTPKSFESLQKKLYFGSQNMQLTINGYRQEQLLGKLIEQKYIKKYNFLPKEYNKKDFSLTSSPTQRTIFSAAGYLSGLYPDNIIKVKFININNDLKNEVNKTIHQNTKNLRSPEKKIFNSNEMVLQLKNDDEIPQLKDFTESEKNPKNIITNSLTKEISLNIDNPLTDRIFHAWKCFHKGNLLVDYLNNLNPIFDITTQEITKALAELENYLKFSPNDYTDKIKTDKDKLSNLVKFYMSYEYHFKLSSLLLSKDTIKTYRKIIINDWYSILNAQNQHVLKIPISELFDLLFTHFKDGIKNHKSPYMKNNNYTKFKVFSAHDTVIINMLRSILDTSYIKENLKSALEDDNIYNFFIPQFGSYMIYELHYDETQKNYFVKVIYDGMKVYEGIKIFNLSEEKDKLRKEIRFERFEEIMKNVINKDYLRLDCDKYIE